MPESRVDEWLSFRNTEYADDVDFLSSDKDYLVQIEKVAMERLASWFLFVNAGKTERIVFQRCEDPKDETWRRSKKLGSLLGDWDDVQRRQMLARVAFRNMWALWFRRQHVSEILRLRLYNAFSKPVLLYNCGTWALTGLQLEKMDAFHRKQLRLLLGVHWPHRIGNSALYTRCNAHPLRQDIMQTRWRLFGHILRLPESTPAQQAMTMFFAKASVPAFLGRARTNLPVVLHADLSMIGKRCKSMKDLCELRNIAKDRKRWNKLVARVLKVA